MSRFGHAARGLLAGLLAWMVCALGGVRAETPVVLYVSAATVAHVDRAGGRYESVLTAWRRLLDARQIAFREVRRPADLPAAPGLLILPSAVALDDAERRALTAWRDGGGSFLATWALGARDATGEWVGHGFMRELLGVAVVGELPDASTARFVVPFGDLPVARSLPAGRRIWIGTLPERPLLLSGGRPAAAYLDWSRTVLERDRWHAAMVHDEAPAGVRGALPGRRVAIGIPEAAWGFQPAEVQALVADALDWLLRRPAAHLAAWPRGLRAAQLIEMDTEDGFGNAIHFAELMEELGSPATFYALTSEARRNADLVRRLLARGHEISFHGEVHYGFRGQPRHAQEKRLRRMLAEMSDLLGERDGWPAGAGRGFRAPTESFDATTEALLVQFGFEHHAADPNSSNDRLPFFSPAGPADAPRPLVVLPRGQFDDLNYIGAGLGEDRIARALIAEYELNRAMGGFALVSVHSQNFADPDRLLRRPAHTALMTHAVEGLVRHIETTPRDVWVASGAQVARWWRDRSRVGLLYREVGGDLALEITVRGDRPVADATVLVSAPRAGMRASVVGAGGAGGAAAPSVQVRDAAGGAHALVFPSLAPGVHRVRIALR